MLVVFRTRFLLSVFCGISLLCGLVSCKPRAKPSSSLESLSQSYYKGHADFRLISVGHSGPEFDPNEDVLSNTGSAHFRETVASKMTQAALASLVPFMKQIDGVKGSPDLVGQCLSFANNSNSVLTNTLKVIQSTPGAVFPYVADYWLIPWEQQVEENIYDSRKISISSLEVANVLKGVPGTESFFKQVTNDIQARRKKMHALPKEPVFLLGVRNFLFVNPGSSKLTVRILLGINPYTGKFEKEDPKVKFTNVTVPDFGDKGITAAFTIEIPLEGTEDPRLLASFGDFASIEKGLFKMAETSRQSTAPRLEGSANVSGTKWIKINFAFKELAVNLRKAQLTDLSALISPGFQVGQARWTAGGINVESVDKTFQDEINKTIDSSIKTAIDKGNNDILGGMLTKPTLERAFNSIFQRG